MLQKENSKKTSPKVFKLSELLEEIQSNCIPKELPLLCQHVLEKEKGKDSCKRTLIMAKSLLGKTSNETFTFCCCNSLKVIPIKISNDDAYLVHTRNIVPDYVHFSEVASLLEKSVEYVEKQLWEPIPHLNETFVEQALVAVEQRASKEKVKLQSQGDALKALGRAYEKRFPNDHPAFDVVVYNMLKGCKLEKRNYEGLVKTTVAVKTEKDSCAVRLIIKNLGKQSDEPPLPIVGMALIGVGSPHECLENKLLGELGKVLLDKWQNKKQGDDLLLSSPNGRWDARVAIHVNDDPDDKLLEDIEMAHEVAINMADNTIGAFLLEQLQREPEHFRKLLDRATRPTVYSTDGVGSNILWFQILEDLKRASPAGSLSFKGDVLRAVFDIPGRHSPLTPAVCERSDSERWRLLRTDLRDKGSRYEEAMEADGGLIFYFLEISNCHKDEMIRYLERCGSASTSGIAKFIKYRSSRGDKEAERAVWETTANFCEKNNNYDILKKLYEAILAPGLPKVLYYLHTEALGMLVTGITAGRIPWYWVAERVARNKSRGFAKQKMMAKVSR